MSDFKAKMHQIRFRLGELTVLPQNLLAGFYELTSLGRGKGRGGKGKNGEIMIDASL